MFFSPEHISAIIHFQTHLFTCYTFAITFLKNSEITYFWIYIERKGEIEKERDREREREREERERERERKERENKEREERRFVFKISHVQVKLLAVCIYFPNTFFIFVGIRKTVLNMSYGNKEIFNSRYFILYRVFCLCIDTCLHSAGNIKWRDLDL